MISIAQKTIAAITVVVVIAIAARVAIIRNRNSTLRNRPAIQKNINIRTNTNIGANTNTAITNTASNTNTGTNTNSSTKVSTSAYGVIGARNASNTAVMSTMKDIGASWVRVNYFFSDSNNPDLAALLNNGFNLVVTFKYDKPGNIDTTYGTFAQWPAAGFPYVNAATFQNDIQSALKPTLPYLSKGRSVYAQIENETSDASIVPQAKYWRGTVNQYIQQLNTFASAVHSLDKRIPVVVAGIPTTELDAVIQSGAKHDEAVKHLTALYSRGTYDAVDLHFYGCVSDIPSKMAWVKQNVHAGTKLISTENGGPDSRCSATPDVYDTNPQQYLQAEASQVSQRLKACADNGGSVCLWFSLFDLSGESAVFTHMGLLDRSNPPEQKPAYDAFKNFTATY